MVSNSQQPILLAEDLHKSYDGRLALQGLSFSLNAGRILGFLGPNGAGKTTAIRILTTILEPNSGHFFVDGISSEFPERVRRKIGVLPESLGFPKNNTPLEYLTYFGQLYGKTKKDAQAHSLQLLEEIGLAQRTKSLIGSFSRGMRQRLGIARALINDPVVVFLDEPTLGLDPKGQQELLALVQSLAEDRNSGVILCSHLLAEVESVCDDVVILRKGQVVASGPVAEIIGQAKRNEIRVHVPSTHLPEAIKRLEILPNILQITPSNKVSGWLNVKFVNPDDTPDGENLMRKNVLESLLQAEIPILSFEAESGRLQDVFLKLTEEGVQ